MLTADQNTLIAQLSATWPAALKLTLSGGKPAGLQSHPLGQEITALAEGRAASLPYFVSGKSEVAWFTLAPNDQEMRAAVEDLRAWVLPSFGWEDPRGAMVLPGEATGALGRLILTMSPAGYFRWQTTKAHAERVVGKLRQMRALEQARPRHTVVRLPSLLELRQEFAVALTAGDRPAAEGAVAAIDRRQLDSADNTLFMRIRLWGRFADFDRIVNHPDLARLVSIRMPHRVRLSILEAFHALLLAPLEDEGKNEEALKQYAARIHDTLGGLIALVDAADPLPARRLLGYCVRVLGDPKEAKELLRGLPDPVLSWLLTALAKQGEEPPPNLEEQFLEARKKLDWKSVQELGEQLIAHHPEYVPLLRRSLEFRPNPALASSLDAREPNAPSGAAAQPAPPRTWAEWLTLLRGGDPAVLEAFLEEREPGAAEGLGPQEVQQLCDRLEELYTDPAAGQDARLRRTLLSGLVEMVDDFVKEPGFPRSDLADVYLGLFRLWGSVKRGSVYSPDSQVLLELAEATLQFGRCDEAEVIGLLRAWWEARPVKALLPFLLGAVEMLDRLGSEGQCENFWVLAGDFVRGDPEVLSLGERYLWRQVGAQIGYDQGTLDEYVPLPEAAPSVDPIRQAALLKMAIISLRERQAQEAAGLLRERSDAQVIVVSETYPGAATQSALSADVVLFVWSATTHAVFRAFDAVDKKRFAYVQGTGASSIVLALERWVAGREETIGTS
jgi:hypothetical protein